MNTTGISNYTLEKYCKKILTKNNFLGVYPCDSYPLKFLMLENASMIFNLSPHYDSGSHFVSILKKSNLIYYFDSFGKKLTNTDIKTFLKKGKFQIKINNVKIQDFNSHFCGLYCLAFLIYSQRNNKPFTFVKIFDKNNLKNNDKIVVQYILNEIKH